MKEKNLTKEWKELQADTKVFLKKLGGKVTAVDTKAVCAPVVFIRNHKEGCTRGHCISAFNGYGLTYLDGGATKYMEWKKVREWDLYHLLREALYKNKEAFSLWKRYEKLLDSTRNGFEEFVEENGEVCYQSSLKLRFVPMRNRMDLYRIGTWGVMLRDKYGEMFEDDFTGLDMTSRCKLADFLAA